MKASLLLLALGGAVVLTGCRTVVVRREPVVARRTVVVEQPGAYRRVYYRDARGRAYYQRAYYNGDVQVRVDSRRYYDARPGPVDRSYGF